MKEIIDVTFPINKKDSEDKDFGMISQGPIQVHSLCPHHLLNIEYECYISYMPYKDGKVLGLSKLARIAKTLGKQPILQEQLGSDIADVMYKTKKYPSVDSQGCAVLLVGKHQCMSCRGVTDNALTTTTDLRGVYWADSFEEKFFKSINVINSSRLRR